MLLNTSKMVCQCFISHCCVIGWMYTSAQNWITNITFLPQNRLNIISFRLTIYICWNKKQAMCDYFLIKKKKTCRWNYFHSNIKTVINAVCPILPASHFYLTAETRRFTSCSPFPQTHVYSIWCCYWSSDFIPFFVVFQFLLSSLSDDSPFDLGATFSVFAILKFSY